MPDQYRRNHDDDRRERGWTDRAGDEVRSWFGDDEARSRRGNDERHDRYPYGGDRDRSWQGQSEGGYGREQRPWRGEDRGYGSERGGQQGGEYGQGGQYGSSSYDRGSYGRGQQSDWERRGDDRSWNRAGQSGQSDWQSGRGERWSGATQGESRWGQGREQESGSGRSSFGGYGTGGYGSGRSESGGYGGGSYGGGSSGSGYGMGGSAMGGEYGGGAGRSYGGGGGSYGGGGSSWGRESYSGRGPKDYKRSDDRIREEVSDRLTDDHQVDATDISVTVQNGEVTLTGTVPTREQKRRAEDCVESISGVREVTNNLRVNRQGQSSPSQDDSQRTSVLGLNETSGTNTQQQTSQGNTSTRGQKNPTTT